MRGTATLPDSPGQPGWCVWLVALLLVPLALPCGPAAIPEAPAAPASPPPVAAPPSGPGPTAGPKPAPTRPGCRFVGGLAALARALGPELVGECVDDERVNPATGNAEQQTTRGLLIWRPAEGLASFTAGASTWYGCPAGVEQRPSNQAFRCPAPVAAAPSVAPTPIPTASPAPMAACPNAIPWSQARTYVGRQATVEGPVVRTNFAERSRGKPTFLDIGAPYPSPDRFTVVIWINARQAFPSPPETLYRGKNICVSGTVGAYQGIPQIEVASPSAIRVVP